MSRNLGDPVQILHVDAPAVTEPTAAALARWDDAIHVEATPSPAAALETIADRPPDCIVAGDDLPEMTGRELLAAVRERFPDLPFVLFVEGGLDEIASDALAAGATDCLRQGGNAEYTLLANRIDHAVSARRAVQMTTGLTDGGDQPKAADHTDATEKDDDTEEYVVADWAATKRKKREAELRRHRDFLRDIQDVADIGGWELDLRTERLRLTDEIYRILEQPLGTELSVEEVLEFYHSADRETIREAVDRLTTDGEPFDHECRIVTTTGEVRWVRVMGKPWRDDSGELLGVHGAFQDITERTEREQELLTKSRALDEAPVGIAITDSTTDDEMVYVNPQFLELTGYPREEVLGRNCRFLQGEGTQPEPVSTLRAAIDSETDASVELRNYRRDGTMFWNHLEIAPVHDETGAVVNYIGFQQDITDRVTQKRELEKRERVLHELHTSTRAFYPPDSEGDIAEFLVEFVDRAFAFDYVAVTQFDEDSGELTPAAVAADLGDESALGGIAPGPNPIWQAYQRGEATVFDGEFLPPAERAVDEPVQQALVVPIGDFGVIVAFDTGHSEIDPVDVELIEVAAANAEAAFQQLHSDRKRNEITSELSSHQSAIEALTDSLDALQAIHRQVADSDSEAAIERAVCTGLLGIDAVDFAWIGRPNGRAADIEPTEWAGDGEEYLDSIAVGEGSGLPAGRAATERRAISVPAIASRVLEESWAKAALSVGYGSVYSVPLVYDDVLYGVLSVYARSEHAFDDLHADLLENVASLAVTYSRILDQRYATAEAAYVEREFSLGGSTYLLQRLAAATEGRIRFDTVLETTDETIRILVTVLDGDSEAVRREAAASAGVLAVEPFGTAAKGQLSLTVRKPFLASVVAKHGGRLLESVSDPSGTTVRIAAPEQAAKRPLIASLLSRYPEIELLAQRRTTDPDAIETTTAAELLTDRQYEILTAAYHGGYYETPRGVTGEALAESFGISSPTVYNHLQAAHRRLLAAVFESEPDLTAENEGLNS
ncbi:PAS domain S-box protein [Halohasta salina]|uniref:PAS domain S-box protein n=1 Tax=Halohasta salina TaxID=2961621 RepID=UPI0020A3FF9D|nr:PAS domain S-box protein [Halohasta salina]